MLEAFEERTVPTAVVTVAATGDANENGASGSFLFTRSDTTGSLTVNVGLSGTATAGTDYNSFSTVFFNPGQGQVAQFVAPINDYTVESTETITATVQSGTGYTVGSPAAAMINLLDNDTATVTVAAIGDATEAGATGVFRFTRVMGDPGAAFTLNYSVGGNATSGSDYTALSGTVSFASFQAVADVLVVPVNDTEAEVTEAVTVGITTGTGYVSGSPSSAAVLIFDNESSVVSVEKTADVAEGDTGGTFRFTRLGDVGSALTVNYTVSGTATTGTSVVLGAGTTHGFKTVTALADNAVEGTETVVLTVTSGTGYTVGSPSSATVDIEDNPPVITVAKLTDGVEGTSNGAFRFTRTGGKVSESLTVGYAVSGNATPGSDYTALSGSVTFSANSATADVTVTVTDDSDYEPSELVIVTVAEGAGYVVGEQDKARAPILDNEVPAGEVEVWYDVAPEQSLEADAGVGLLANYDLGSFGELAITSITLPGSSPSYYDPDDEIEVPGWGTLTVAADGSFTFAPDESASGAFLFWFDFSDGTNTGFGTAALWVGGAGAEFAANELVAAPAGSLTFKREWDDAHSTGFGFFTVKDVLFRAVPLVPAGPLLAVYQIFGAELANVQDTAYLQLPGENETRDVVSDLVNFTFEDGQDLVKHVADVRFALNDAIWDIENALGDYPESGITVAIDRWFKGNGEGAGHAAPTLAQVETILGVFQFVADDLDSRTVPYENIRSNPLYAGVYGANDGSGEIVLGGLYWRVGVTAADRFGTVIHELTHTDPSAVLEGTGDAGYFKNPDSLEDVVSPVVWRLNEQNVTVTTADLVNNADSYAGYLTQFYYLGVPV